MGAHETPCRDGLRRGEGNQMWADRTLKFRSSSKLPRGRCPFMIVSRSQCLLLSSSDARAVLLPEWHLLGKRPQRSFRMESRNHAGADYSRPNCETAKG